MIICKSVHSAKRKVKMKKTQLLGERIRDERLHQNITQQELADAVGFTSKTSINKIERGTANISYLTLVKIAEALNVSTSYLSGETSRKTRTPLDVAFDKFYTGGHIALEKKLVGDQYPIIEALYAADSETKRKCMKMIQAGISANETVFQKAYDSFMRICTEEQ